MTDVRSNIPEQIRNAALVLKRSKDRHEVFSAIYRGKRKCKTVSEIARTTRLDRIRVLQEAGKLADNNIVRRTKIGRELAYEKDSFYSQHKSEILSLARNKRRMMEYPTKSTPQITTKMVKVYIPRNMIDVQRVTIDDVDSFSRARQVRSTQKEVPIYEAEMKSLLKRILGERGEFRDWGGETDDLFSTRLKILGRRKAVAFGLKGKGTTGTLTPKKMGKNADQIQRLFRSPADVYFVQYNGQIGQSVVEQMEAFATAKSASEARRIYHGLIDGQDTRRLIAAYSKAR